MKIYKEIVKINKELGGKLVRPSSLDFACDEVSWETNVYKKVAYIIRAIVVDHPFSDMNKSTAIIFTIRIFEREKINGSEACLKRMIKNVAVKNVNSIEKIEKMLRRCYPKKK